MLTEVRKEFKIMLLSVKYNIIKHMANPVSFVLNIILMMLNNSAFIVQWIILFSLKDSFGIYGIKEVCLLWGLSAACYGVSRIVFGGAFKIPDLIENGKLDSFLVLPKNTLLSVLSSHTEISAIGDLLYGIIVALIFFHKPHEIALIILFIILGSIIETAFAVILNSLAFKYIRVSDFTNSVLGMFTTFSVYPETVFNKALRVLFYTIIPVGIATYLPLNTILEFNIYNIIIITLFTVAIVLFADISFKKGLRKYTSSNLMSSR